MTPGYKIEREQRPLESPHDNSTGLEEFKDR